MTPRWLVSRSVQRDPNAIYFSMIADQDALSPVRLAGGGGGDAG